MGTAAGKVEEGGKVWATIYENKGNLVTQYNMRSPISALRFLEHTVGAIDPAKRLGFADSKDVYYQLAEAVKTITDIMKYPQSKTRAFPERISYLERRDSYVREKFDMPKRTMPLVKGQGAEDRVNYLLENVVRQLGKKETLHKFYEYMEKNPKYTDALNYLRTLYHKYIPEMKPSVLTGRPKYTGEYSVITSVR